MTTLEYLKQYETLCNQVKNTWDKIQDVEERLTSVSPVQGDGSSHGYGVSDKVGIGIAEKDFLIKQYDMYVDLREDMKNHILETLKKMPCAKYRSIIWLRYVCFNDFPAIAKKIHIYDVNYVRCRLNSLALNQYTKYCVNA